MNSTFIMIVVLTAAIVVAIFVSNIMAKQAIDEELKALSEDPCIKNALDIAQKNTPFGIKSAYTSASRI